MPLVNHSLSHSGLRAFYGNRKKFNLIADGARLMGLMGAEVMFGACAGGPRGSWLWATRGLSLILCPNEGPQDPNGRQEAQGVADRATDEAAVYTLFHCQPHAANPVPPSSWLSPMIFTRYFLNRAVLAKLFVYSCPSEPCSSPRR